MEDLSPLATKYAVALAGERNLNLLWSIRKHDIQADGPVNLKIGPFLREETKLKEFQKQAVAHLFLMPRMIIADGTGLGKAQPLTSKVLTPMGWKQMGELQIGDEVVDPDGGVGVVRGVYPQGIKPVFRVTTTDGGSTLCCEEHLWTVQTNHDRNDHKSKGKFRTLSLKDLQELGLQEISNGAKTTGIRSKFFLPIPVETHWEKPTPTRMNPYLLGLLVGDGSFSTSSLRLTTADLEIVEKVQDILPEKMVIKCLQKYDYSITFQGTGNPLLDVLRYYDLHGKRSWEKSLPKEALLWSLQDRKDLLAGLLDTDGECTKLGGVYFHSCSKELINTIVELVQSLGGICHLNKPRTSKFTYKGEKRIGRIQYRLLISLPFNPFRLTRKRDRWKPSRVTRTLESIQPEGSVDCQCIEVSTKRNLYITDDYLVTHNTITAIAGMCYQTHKNPDLKILLITTKSVMQQFKSEIERFSHLSCMTMADTYQKQDGHEARMAQIRYWLSSEGPTVMCTRYTALIGRRREAEGGFDEDGIPARPDGKELLSREIKDLVKELSKTDPDNLLIIFDECHKLKSKESQTRMSMMQIQNVATRVWGLSASLISNGADEIYCVLSALGVRPLGSLSAFESKYCEYKMQRIGRKYVPKLLGYRNMKEYKTEVRPFIYGRSPKQVKEDLPELTTKFYNLDLNKTQSKLLLRDIPSGEFQLLPKIVKTAYGELELKERDPNNVGTLMSVYQLVSNHPALLEDGEKMYTKTLSPKEEALFDLLEGDLAGQKVVIFSKFKRYIDRLQRLMKDRGITLLRVTGAEKDTERERAKKLFQDSESGHNLIAINSAGLEGINLQVDTWFVSIYPLVLETWCN
jgi:hypothetical protein